MLTYFINNCCDLFFPEKGSHSIAASLFIDLGSFLACVFFFFFKLFSYSLLVAFLVLGL